MAKNLENMNIDERKNRAPNFTAYEKDLLIDLVISKYKDTIESKKTDSVTVKQKESACKALAADFNSHPNVARRDWKTLQLCYKNVKRRTKKSAANDKVNIHRTGGGPFVQPTVDETGRKLVAALKPQFLPLACDTDCDTNFHQEVIFDVRHCDVDDPLLPMETVSESQSVAVVEEVDVSGVYYNKEQAPDTDISPGPSRRTSTPKKRKFESDDSLRANYYRRRMQCLEEEHTVKMENFKIEQEIKKFELAAAKARANQYINTV